MKSLATKPNLEFLKKEAKALRNLHRQGNVACCDTIRNNDTSLKKKTDTEILAAPFSINDAQRIVAREYGYTSWATLKHYIESLDSPLFQGVSDKQAYHKSIVDSYDARSPVYDKHVWARETSLQTVDYCPPAPGDHVLDIATGTGTIAFYVAPLVGATGSVTGIDIAKGMLQRCNEKLADTDFKNVRFIYGDAENLDFATGSFDKIYCNGALYWMTNPLAALRHWFELLKSDGVLGFTAWPDSSFLWGDGARRALRKHGINFTVHEFSGNQQKTRALVELAGFSQVQLHEVKDGNFVNVDDAKGPPLTLDAYTPGQYPNPITNVSEDVLQRVHRDYEAEVDKHITDEGVWLDRTMYYVYGKKE